VIRKNKLAQIDKAEGEKNRKHGQERAVGGAGLQSSWLRGGSKEISQRKKGEKTGVSWLETVGKRRTHY